MFSTERSKYRCPMSSLLMMPRRVADNIENRRRKPAKPNFKCHLTLPRQVRAIERVERLKGSTEPVLMRADDGHLYVVKFCTNPLGPRILVNEYLAVRLARSLGMATPEAAVVQVPESLGSPGLHFGSRLYKSRGNVYIHDWLPAAVWGLVTNPGDLIGAYVFDAWTGNADCRQVIFVRKAGLTPYQLLLIDNGHCFGGRSWRLHGLAVQCPRKLSFAYATVGGRYARGVASRQRASGAHAAAGRAGRAPARGPGQHCGPVEPRRPPIFLLAIPLKPFPCAGWPSARKDGVARQRRARGPNWIHAAQMPCQSHAPAIQGTHRIQSGSTDARRKPSQRALSALGVAFPWHLLRLDLSGQWSQDMPRLSAANPHRWGGPACNLPSWFHDVPAPALAAI